MSIPPPREYLAAQQLTPEDHSLSGYLEFPELRTAAAAGNPTAWLLLARSFQLQNRAAAALKLLEQYRDGLESLRRSQTNSPNRQYLTQAEAWEPTAALWQAELQTTDLKQPHPKFYSGVKRKHILPPHILRQTSAPPCISACFELPQGMRQPELLFGR